MANMSYCRFENTLRDLKDCEDAMQDDDDMSESEERARVQLINLCIQIAKDYGPGAVSNALFAIPDAECKLPKPSSPGLKGN